MRPKKKKTNLMNLTRDRRKTRGNPIQLLKWMMWNLRELNVLPRTRGQKMEAARLECTQELTESELSDLWLENKRTLSKSLALIPIWWRIIMWGRLRRINNLPTITRNTSEKEQTWRQNSPERHSPLGCSNQPSFRGEILLLANFPKKIYPTQTNKMTGNKILMKATTEMKPNSLSFMIPLVRDKKYSQTQRK